MLEISLPLRLLRDSIYRMVSRLTDRLATIVIVSDYVYQQKGD